MAFPSAAITEVLATAASGAFNGADATQVREWVEFVIGVDPNPAGKHDVFYYIAVARLLAESVGSVWEEELNAKGFAKYFCEEYLRPLTFPDGTILFRASWWCGPNSALQPGYPSTQNMVESFMSS